VPGVPAGARAWYKNGTVIAGAHTLIYAEDAAATRAFFRDVLGFESVDAGSGWLIFELPPGELGVHPGPAQSGPVVGQSELYFMCADVERTVAELEAKGVEFTAGISDESYGRTTRFAVPGFGEMYLYEPRHASPLADFSSRPG
jgi:catechol 2,3-dioxygenase-like lactoylglutathione lyase family enzyme